MDGEDKQLLWKQKGPLI